ncbi:hypothetical protein GC425_08830 [Corynebacterium sp. zg254]|uniref:YprB ribonuclease H-like domain-containing protein n=1 Tax=Corynebacterium zhongnanshanii TaxID=2768834 RepID=A0ABQ6VCR7_9CORY|nr:ribonuclease H-like domain-containing protein [Corynebacterium zhongnanshanii]KAB3520001.1 hypothetical protein F8377_08870 [Corynebacterium zhongnanshanii]MCR5914951.1 hypothetical protein [Corynebacterium sp. zg254]
MTTLLSIVSAPHDPAQPITPRDVVGCRHRTVLTHAAAAGIVAPDRRTDYSIHVERYTHRLSVLRRQAQIFSLLPSKPRRGDAVRRLTRVDISNQDYAEGLSVECTLEAMAEGTRLITNAHLAEGPLDVRVDLLVREDQGSGVDEHMRYMPVIFSGHAVAKKVAKRSQANCRVVDVSALGLGTPLPAPWRRKNNSGDTQTVAMAHTVLSAWGFASTEVGFVSAAGDAAYRCFTTSAQPMLAGLYAALKEPLPIRPTRIKECATCDFHNHCRIQLLQRNDISLLLPGAKSTPLRERGIETLEKLASEKMGEVSHLSEAWMRGEAALRRPLKRWVTDPQLWGGRAFTVDTLTPTFSGELDWVDEVDVDMEAHPERGTFLWGTFDGSRYIAFSDFSAGDDGQHVAEFWRWLMGRKTASEERGRHFQAWVYAAQGENYWLRYYADHYGGRSYPTAQGDVVMPTRAEVDEFLASESWCDVFEIVKRALAGTGSLGLKTVSPLAGFHFSQEGVNGRAAVTLFEQAVGSAAGVAATARRTLERYNADDCVATRQVRYWLRRGAPGMRSM